MIGTTDVSSTTSYVLSALSGGLVPSGAISVNNTAGAGRGTVTLGTAVNASGTAILTATFANGAVIVKTLMVTVTRAATPAPSGTTSGFVTSFTATSDATGAVVTAEITVTSDGAGKVFVAASSDYDGGSATNWLVNGAFKIGYRTTSGGTITDLTAFANGNASYKLTDPIEYVSGNFSIAKVQVTLPAASTNYIFVLVAKKISGAAGAALTFNGSSLTVGQT